ncbi:autophagy-related protein [Striga asiatica]|uniref:Autophagy-related protein n=1 Tax=Striga asiatica TaxID=4170 RepID=A0A5A7QPZ5_STRAF|nr:autophagy-related protein [Striga asiatica]
MRKLDDDLRTEKESASEGFKWRINHLLFFCDALPSIKTTAALQSERKMDSRFLTATQEGFSTNAVFQLSNWKYFMGMHLYLSATYLKICAQVVGAFNIVEMLYRSNLLAIVGAGEQPSLSPRRLCLFNTISGAAIRELNFLTSILAVRVNRKRLIVLLKEQTYIYDVNTLEVKRIIDTVPNLQGLCAFSANMDNPYVALPASTEKGSVLVYNVMDLQSHCEVCYKYSFIADSFPCLQLVITLLFI